MSNQYDDVQSAIQEIKNGQMVIVCDDKKREGEGDFIFAAEKANHYLIKHAVTVGCGAYICLVAMKKRLEELKLFPQVSDDMNSSFNKTAFYVSYDAAPSLGVTTGSSFHDRAVSAKIITEKDTKPEDLVRAGHVIPLCAEDGGLKSRQGHTEAALDLVRLAGMYPAAVDLELVGHDGHMAQEDELFYIAKTYGHKIIKIEDMIEYIEANNIDFLKQ